MNWFLLALKNTFNFKGRARRREYGWFVLITFLINFSVEFLITAATAMNSEGALLSLSIVLIILGIWFWIAGISVTARRLHDLGYSGLWQLAPWGIILLAVLVASVVTEAGGILAILGGICWIIFGLWLLFKDGQPQANQYGESPKYPPQV